METPLVEGEGVGEPMKHVCKGFVDEARNAGLVIQEFLFHGRAQSHRASKPHQEHEDC